MNINRPDQENTRGFNMYECHLQVVYYFIHFLLADTQFPSVVRLEKRSK